MIHHWNMAMLDPKIWQLDDLAALELAAQTHHI